MQAMLKVVQGVLPVGKSALPKEMESLLQHCGKRLAKDRITIKRLYDVISIFGKRNGKRTAPPKTKTMGGRKNSSSTSGLTKSDVKLQLQKLQRQYGVKFDAKSRQEVMSLEPERGMQVLKKAHNIVAMSRGGLRNPSALLVGLARRG